MGKSMLHRIEPTQGRNYLLREKPERYLEY